LIKAGHDINATDNFGMNAFHQAGRNGYFTLCDFLLGLPQYKLLISTAQNNELHQVVVTPPTSAQKTQLASLVGNLIKKGVDLNHQNNKKETPLHKATLFSNIAAVELLLMHGADISLPDKNGETVLHYASRKNDVPSLSKFVQQKCVQLHTLARKGFDGDCLDIAHKYNNIAVIEFLDDFSTFARSNFSDDTWVLCFSFLGSISQLVNVGCTCKKFLQLSSKDSLWKPLYTGWRRKRKGLGVETYRESYIQHAKKQYHSGAVNTDLNKVGIWGKLFGRGGKKKTDVAVEEVSLQFTLVGPQGAGKTSLLYRFTDDKFPVDISIDNPRQRVVGVGSGKKKKSA